MRYLSIVFGLAAAASAIDVRLDASSNCDRTAYICTALEPNVCCGAPQGLLGSIGFYGVPTNWNIEVRGHSRSNDNRCGVQKTQRNLSGTNFACLTGGGFTGAGWGFRGKKWIAEACDADADVQTCTLSRRPDVFVFEDKTRYNIADMEDSLLEELVALGLNGTVAADVPEVFKKFKMAAF